MMDFGLDKLADYESKLEKQLEQYLQQSEEAISKGLSNLTNSLMSSYDLGTPSAPLSEIPLPGQQAKAEDDMDSNKVWATTLPTLKLPSFMRDTKRPLKAEPSVQNDLSLTKPVTPFQLAQTAAGCEITIDHTQWINFAQFHANVSPIRQIKVVNKKDKPLESLMLDVTILPVEYGHSWQQTRGNLAVGEEWEITNIPLPLSTNRLRAITETERANLRFTISSGRNILHVQTSPIDVHPINQFLYTEGTERFLATYVTPNRDPIKEAVSKIAASLDRRTTDPSLSGYQSRSPARAFEMMRAVHDVLIDDYQINYINPPPGGGVNHSRRMLLQNVRPVEEVLANRRGTCLDLSILLAALLEAIGLNPLLVLIPGHAFVGCWTKDAYLPVPVVDLVSSPKFLQLLQQDDIILFNSTTLCDSLRISRFEDAVNDAIYYVNQQFHLASQQVHYKDEHKSASVKLIDIQRCREEGIPSLP
jgi:hypothetical protein